MHISVIIPTINESQAISKAVKSCWEAGADEIIVADGGSTDATISIAKSLRCEVVISSPGRGVQQNHGASLASGNLFLFLHADCYLAPTCLDQIRQSRQSLDHLYGAFRQTIPNCGRIYRLIERGNAQRVKRLKMIYGDQGLFVSSQLFHLVGGFPEIPLMEDVAISRQLSRHAVPQLLSGPLTISPRRWERYGPIRQTLRNWTLLTRFFLGQSPESIARLYRRHDQK